MSRSNPPRSSIVAKLRHASTAAGPAPPRRRPLRRRLAIRFAAVMLWLHIYLSMFGLAAVLFFSVTGLTLNHPDWLFKDAERVVRAEGQIDSKWLHLDVPATAAGDVPDLSRQVAKLEVVEHLRTAHGIRGAVADFQVLDERECLVTFKGPGYEAVAFIDRTTGRYDVTETSLGLIAVVNDLHKGRDTGPVWSVVIDLAAIVMTVISLTGLILLFYLRLRRVRGLIVALAGAAVVVAVVLIWVP